MYLFIDDWCTAPSHCANSDICKKIQDINFQDNFVLMNYLLSVLQVVVAVAGARGTITNCGDIGAGVKLKTFWAGGGTVS